MPYGSSERQTLWYIGRHRQTPSKDVAAIQQHVATL